jgi:hypothetical protein
MGGALPAVSLSPFVPGSLSREWPILLDCCSFAPVSAGNSSWSSGSFDAAALVTLAAAHGVTAQLAANLMRKNIGVVPETFRNALYDARREQMFFTLPLVAELFRALEILNAAQITAAVVKGPVLSMRAFADPAARSFGDIDFLLRHEDILRASELLAAAGYQPHISADAIRAQKTPGQYMFSRLPGSLLIELHTERTLRYFPRPLPIDSFFRRKTTVSIDGRSVPALSAEDEFVLISVHGAKHFWERLMWISDVAAMIHNHPELDWNRIRQSAEEVGAERMVRVALLLAERLLRVAVPAKMKREVASDSACPPIVKKIESWLPYAGYKPPALMRRALFRFRMRGQLLAGAGYLTRLSLSTTEEDWSDDPDSARARLREALRRPFRLARKYRRDPGDSRDR